MKQTLFPATLAAELQFRHMPKSNDLQLMAQQHIESLRNVTGDDARWEVLFDQSHSSKNGTIYRTVLRLRIPGQPLYITRNTELGGSKELLFSALNRAFRDIRRQLIRHHAKRHDHRRLAA